MNTSPEVRAAVNNVTRKCNYAAQALADSALLLADIVGYERDAVLAASLSNIVTRAYESFAAHLAEIDAIIATQPGAVPLKTLLKEPAEPLVENDFVVEPETLKTPESARPAGLRIS